MKWIIGPFVGLLIFSIIFGAIEKFFGTGKTLRTNQDRKIDIFYWFLTPFLNKTVVKFGTIVIVGGGFYLLGLEHFRETLTTGRGPIAQWPWGAQLLGALIVGDFTAYWMHRFFHTSRFWKIHAVHHGSTGLNWMSSLRIHPLNSLASRCMQAATIISLGFPVGIAAAYVPILAGYGILLHSNVNWNFGPLKYVIASPAFHRWHHTSQNEGLDKNFSGFFPIWDLLFGTFYMPADKFPEVFGLAGERVPDSVWGQILYPFKKSSET